ncbi:MAG: hypothetical protein V4671_11965 [Armatimonadota bacterium]
MSHLVAFVLFVGGCFIGLKFPDFDQTFRWYPLLVHRSILTHSFLFPLLLIMSFGAMRREALSATRWFVMGLSAAIAVHLCFDLFPRYWTGFARIHFPFYGAGPTWISQVCLALSAFVCLLLACRLLRNARELYLLLGGLIVTYGVSAAKQPNLSFWALVTLVIVSFVALLVARPKYQHDENALVRKYLHK